MHEEVLHAGKFWPAASVLGLWFAITPLVTAPAVNWGHPLVLVLGRKCWLR